jgi:uncharacterized protein
MTSTHEPAAGTAASGSPLYHRFRSELGEHVLIVPQTRIYDLPAEAAAAFDADAGAASALADVLGLSGPQEVALDSFSVPRPQQISLNVTSNCNLACAYCYAGRGSFEGKQVGAMRWDTARQSIDRLFASCERPGPVTIGFIGGEPFLNRRLIHDCVGYARRRSNQLAIDARFAVTTNGTMLRADDIELLRGNPFAVTVSVDGGALTHDRHRPLAGSAGGSFGQLARAIGPLVEEPGLARVCARSTVTSLDLDLVARFEAIVALGFIDVGFSPVRAGCGALGEADWGRYLDALIAVAVIEIARARDGAPLRLSNLAIALKQLHRGFSSPYPCGAGGGYFSIGTDGNWYACHRAIGDERFRLGNQVSLEEAVRQQFLAERHVHAQAECRSCWARYLCSGGCHHEAAHRTVQSCNYIRGWIEFCLATYCDLMDARPDLFEPISIVGETP